MCSMPCRTPSGIGRRGSSPSEGAAAWVLEGAEPIPLVADHFHWERVAARR